MRIRWLLGSMALLALVAIEQAQNPYKIEPEYDICNPKTIGRTPPTVFMEQLGMQTEIFVRWDDMVDHSHHYYCYMLFKTLPEYRFIVKAVPEYFDYTSACTLDDPLWRPKDKCQTGCIYFLLYDAFYRDKILHQIASTSQVFGFRTFSSQLYVDACGTQISPNITMRFIIEVAVKEQLISFNPSHALPQRTFATPFFPNPYVQNQDVFRYNFQSSIGVITLTFDDWIISPNSVFTFNKANIVSPVTGVNKRPYVVSYGNTMNMTFNTGPHTIPGAYYSFLGFKAVAKFYENRIDVPDILMDCDDNILTATGGVLHIGEELADNRNRDCIWTIAKLDGYDGVYLRVLNYDPSTKMFWRSSGPGIEYELEVRQGLTSMGDSLVKFTPLQSPYHLFGSQTSRNGFYIRIKGAYTNPDALIIAYAQFRYSCHGLPMSQRSDWYPCDNGRCIHRILQCDGYDHCGDNSDEATCDCTTGSTTHFVCPSTGRCLPVGFRCDGQDQCGDGSDEDDCEYYNTVMGGGGSSSYHIGVSVVIPVVVSIFLIFIICLLIIFIRRCRRIQRSAYGNGGQSAQQRGRRRRRRNRGDRTVQMSVTVTSAEHPPPYEEVINSPPVGILNMAFTWAGMQPPSYEEATSFVTAPLSSVTSREPLLGTSSGQGANTTTTNATEGSIMTAPGHNSRQRPVSLSSALDPNADVSSSSSSDLSDNETRLDMSSTSDSSASNENGFFAGDDAAVPSATCQTSPRHDVRSPDSESPEAHDFTGSRKEEREGAIVVIDSLTGDHKQAVNVSKKPEESGEQSSTQGEMLIGHEDKSNARGKRRSRRRDAEDGRGRGGQGQSNRNRTGEVRRVKGSDVERDTARNRSDGGRRTLKDQAGVNNDRTDPRETRGSSRENVNRDERALHTREGGQRNESGPDPEAYPLLPRAYPDVRRNSEQRFHSPKVSESSRSQSLADLSLRTPENDAQKRFSYSGTGDKSVREADLSDFRDQTRARQLESRDRYRGQSLDSINRRCEERERRLASRGVYEHGELPDIVRSSRDLSRNEETASFRHDQQVPNRSRSLERIPSNSPNSVDPSGSSSKRMSDQKQLPLLAPVKENIFDDVANIRRRPLHPDQAAERRGPPTASLNSSPPYRPAGQTSPQHAPAAGFPKAHGDRPHSSSRTSGQPSSSKRPTATELLFPNGKPEAPRLPIQPAAGNRSASDREKPPEARHKAGFPEHTIPNQSLARIPFSHAGNVNGNPKPPKPPLPAYKPKPRPPSHPPPRDTTSASDIHSSRNNPTNFNHGLLHSVSDPPSSASDSTETSFPRRHFFSHDPAQQSIAQSTPEVPAGASLEGNQRQPSNHVRLAGNLDDDIYV